MLHEFVLECFSDSEMAIPAPCGAASTDGSNDAEQPDPDYIKMFVGQIPRAMNEQDLMDMFGEYGRVYQLNLLRDKFTGVSKGEEHISNDFYIRYTLHFTPNKNYYYYSIDETIAKYAFRVINYPLFKRYII